MKETLDEYIFNNYSDLMTSCLMRFTLLAKKNESLKKDVEQLQIAFDTFKFSVRTKLQTQHEVENG